MHQGTSSYRANDAVTMQPVPNSYFVGGTNFTYIRDVSKLGSKLEQSEPARIIKQESNNNQVKQRIIYEIATEVSFCVAREI